MKPNMKKQLFEFMEWAREYLLENFKHRNFIIRRKSVNDFVTTCDEKVEKEFLKLVDCYWPDASIIAEEKISRQRNGELTFIIDPLDGTNNFAFKIPFWGTSISVFKQKVPYFSIVGLHTDNMILYCKTSEGAFANNKKINVTKRELKDSLILFDSRLEKIQKYKFEQGLFRIGNTVTKTRMLGAAVYNICYVALGNADAGIEFELKPVDYPASCHILEEAGGYAKPIYGAKKWQELKQCGLIATTRKSIAIQLENLLKNKE